MSGNESPPKRELPWTDVEVAKLRRTFPTLSASALGRLPPSREGYGQFPKVPSLARVGEPAVGSMIAKGGLE